MEEKPTTMVEKIRKDLLINYDPYALPLLDTDHRLSVYIALVCHHVTLVCKQHNSHTLTFVLKVRLLFFILH